MHSNERFNSRLRAVSKVRMSREKWILKCLIVNTTFHILTFINAITFASGELKILGFTKSPSLQSFKPSKLGYLVNGSVFIVRVEQRDDATSESRLFHLLIPRFSHSNKSRLKNQGRDSFHNCIIFEALYFYSLENFRCVTKTGRFFGSRDADQFQLNEAGCQCDQENNENNKTCPLDHRSRRDITTA